MVDHKAHRSDARSWLAAFSSALASGEAEKASLLFGDECFWRDLVAFTWNVKTLEGRDEIAAMLDAQLAAANPTVWSVEGEPTESDGVVEAWIAFETKARARTRNSAAQGRPLLDPPDRH